MSYPITWTRMLLNTPRNEIEASLEKYVLETTVQTWKSFLKSVLVVQIILKFHISILAIKIYTYVQKLGFKLKLEKLIQTTIIFRCFIDACFCLLLHMYRKFIILVWIFQKIICILILLAFRFFLTTTTFCKLISIFPLGMWFVPRICLFTPSTQKEWKSRGAGQTILNLIRHIEKVYFTPSTNQGDLLHLQL
jgi:hypothetical protein